MDSPTPARTRRAMSAATWCHSPAPDTIGGAGESSRTRPFDRPSRIVSGPRCQTGRRPQVSGVRCQVPRCQVPGVRSQVSGVGSPVSGLRSQPRPPRDVVNRDDSPRPPSHPTPRRFARTTNWPIHRPGNPPTFATLETGVWSVVRSPRCDMSPHHASMWSVVFSGRRFEPGGAGSLDLPRSARPRPPTPLRRSSPMPPRRSPHRRSARLPPSRPVRRAAVCRRGRGHGSPGSRAWCATRPVRGCDDQRVRAPDRGGGGGRRNGAVERTRRPV